ncbi:MAG: hypothetical protein KDA85_20590 [Planctomycetaceae bacterium]|nr:hypothetical protein [Planctomycetaceae bacterium]
MERPYSQPLYGAEMSAPRVEGTSLSQQTSRHAVSNIPLVMKTDFQ